MFYLHYPCLLLATETKYFKAEKASQPAGLLFPVLLPAQGRDWSRMSQILVSHGAYSPTSLGGGHGHCQVGLGYQPSLSFPGSHTLNTSSPYLPRCRLLWESRFPQPELKKPSLLPCTLGGCTDEQALSPRPRLQRTSPRPSFTVMFFPIFSYSATDNLPSSSIRLLSEIDSNC